ncbi:hypothetical protein P8452_10845 [Trifolium repens]|nr:hypothetical protein P8452_10845 [Trifolium repens]
MATSSGTKDALPLAGNWTDGDLKHLGPNRVPCPIPRLKKTWETQVKKKTKGSSSKVRTRRVLPRKAKAPQQVPQQQQPVCISSDEIDEDWAEFLKTYKPSDEEFLDNSFGEEQFDSPPSEGIEVVKPHSSPVSPSDFDEDYVEYLKTYQPPDEYADDELLPFVIQQRRSKGAKPSKGKSMPK